VSNLIIASQFNLNYEALRNVLVTLVNKEWIDANPVISLPVSKIKDVTADTIAKVCASFNLQINEYHALWQDYSEPCAIRYNGFGRYNSLAGHNRNMLMANDATHALVIWNGEDRDLKELIRVLKFNGKQVHVVLVNV